MLPDPKCLQFTALAYLFPPPKILYEPLTVCIHVYVYCRISYSMRGSVILYSTPSRALSNLLYA